MGKLKASTLVEVLIAMVILSIAFGLGLMIYFNSINNSSSYLSSRGQVLLLQEFNYQIGVSNNKPYDEDLSVESNRFNYDSEKTTELLEIVILNAAQDTICSSQHIIVKAQ